MFTDRLDAGVQLSKALKQYEGRENTVVIGLPRGGVVPAYMVAMRLQLPLDVVMVKKIGHPLNSEYAIGAVSLKGRVMDSRSDVSDHYIRQATEKIRKQLKERYELYRGSSSPLELRDKTVLLVDDGVATGNTFIASVDLVREEHPEKIVAAVPVGPSETIERLKRVADEVVCLESHRKFYAIAMYYEEFGEVTDEEVVEFLSKETHKVR